MKEHARQIVEARWFEPFMIGLILFQRQLVRGLTAGAVKG